MTFCLQLLSSPGSLHRLFYFLLVFTLSQALTNKAMSSSSSSSSTTPPLVELEEHMVGFVGVGKITSCVVRGLCSTTGTIPKRIYISPRNKEKATALQSEFPDVVEIASNNEEVVSKSDIVFIGLLPQVAKEILPNLDFTDKEVISMMATIDIADLLTLTKRPPDRAVRTVPLPSAQYREGYHSLLLIFPLSFYH